MAWDRPPYSRREVNEAGALLLRFMRDVFGQKEISHTIGPEEFEHAIDVVDNFRAAHAFPMNTMQVF